MAHVANVEDVLSRQEHPQLEPHDKLGDECALAALKKRHLCAHIVAHACVHVGVSVYMCVCTLTFPLFSAPSS